MHTAAALSEHPLATHAVGECVGRLLETGRIAPDLLALFVTRPQLGALEDIVRAARHLLRPATTIGMGAESVIGGSREVEHHSAVAMFALWGDDPGGTPRPRTLRLRLTATPDGPSLQGATALSGAEGTLVLLTDPFSVPSASLIDQLRDQAPGLQVVGGAATAARGPGGNLLVADGELHRDGAVGVLLPASIPVRTMLARSSAALGATFTVTDVDAGVLTGLGGRPALDRLEEQLSTLEPEARAAALDNLRLGTVLDEADPDRHVDVQPILGIDRHRHGLVLAGSCQLGESVRFELRSPAAAAHSLTEQLSGQRAAGVLVFGSVERGHMWFGQPDHDAILIDDALSAPAAGAFVSDQFAPLVGRHHEHREAVVAALFG